MKNIFLDNFQIHSNTEDLGFIVSPDISGLEQPEIRLPYFDRPNVDGAIVPNQLYGGRLITLSGMVYGPDVSTYRARRRAFETSTNIKRSLEGVLSPITLKFKTMDDLELQTDVYTRKFDFPDKFMKSGRYKIDFLAPTLYLLSQEQKSNIIYVFDAGGMEIPMTLPLSFNANSSSLGTLNNAGNVEAFPSIIITGPLEDPVLTNETNGQSMNLTYALTTSAEFIVIDTILRTVLYYADVDTAPVNIRSAMTGDFITLSPGDNIVKLVVANFADGNAQLAWRDSYSGL